MRRPPEHSSRSGFGASKVEGLVGRFLARYPKFFVYLGVLLVILAIIGLIAG